MLRILDRLEEIIIASLMGAATLLIFVSVVHRFGTGISFLYPFFIQIHIAWAQELCIYMFIWMAKFGRGKSRGLNTTTDTASNCVRAARTIAATRESKITVRNSLCASCNILRKTRL